MEKQRKSNVHTVDHLKGKNHKILGKLLNDISEENYCNTVENMNQHTRNT